MAVNGIRNLNTLHNNDRKIANAVVRSSNIPAGYNKEQTAEEIKSILKIEGDAVGTLNTQDVHNKTLNGGFF